MVKTLRRRASNNRSRQKPRTPTDDVKHIINTGLPPGIDIQDAVDPGKQVPPKPAEKRS